MANSAQAVPEVSAPSLRFNFTWTFAGSVIYAACQWGMLSILAKAGTSAIVGKFALGLAIAAPVFMLTNLQLRGVQATDARSEFDFSDYFSLRLLASLAGLVAVLGIAFICRYDRETRFVIILIGFSKFVESLSDVVAGLLQKMERLDCVAKSMIVRGAFSALAFGLVFRLSHNLVAAISALVVVWTMVLVVYDFFCAKALLCPGESFLAFRRRRLNKLALLSAPLGIVMALNSLNINIPRYILERYRGPAELGVFASLAYLLVALNLIVGALGQSATTRLSCMFASGDRRGFLLLMTKLVLIGAAILGAGVPAAMLFGRPVLTLVYRPEYAQNLTLFVVMVATAGVGAIATFLGHGMTAARQFWVQMPIIGLCVTITVGLSLAWVPRFGLLGAANALLLSSIVTVLAFALVLWRAVQKTELR